ncbi:DUF3465 domain-containing protein [Shewanella atlantica]|uniref:DUF3465 domain-containing protein n=1 Tax=Shewanella atlantica TaxID=271099 RepID=A0A431WBA3_9GAMM|nr:DUF3465 domain-containing protein [Shewanella atlantica]RTR32761.1 DUF3465 domain-containing protein [Shewanella atlantica]
MHNRIVKGTLVRWKDDKGFGFIEPETASGTDSHTDVFIHVSQLRHMSRRPQEGDTIFFQIEHKPGGKLNAVEARIEGVEAKADANVEGQIRSKAKSRSKSNSKLKPKHGTPIGPILYRIGIMMVVLAIASFAYNRVIAPFLASSSTVGIESKVAVAPDDSSQQPPSSVQNSSIQNGSVQKGAIAKGATQKGTSQLGTSQIAEAFKNRQSGLQVNSSGTVSKILSDDNEGSRHQRFILRLSNGQTLLIAHNIDLAPRISGIAVGDNVAFYGQYEFNNKGGVVHWTHHDPQGRHPDGWLKYKGKTYQ